MVPSGEWGIGLVAHASAVRSAGSADALGVRKGDIAPELRSFPGVEHEACDLGDELEVDSAAPALLHGLRRAAEADIERFIAADVDPSGAVAGDEL